MSVFTHLSLSPINIAAALCSAKAYNSAYAKGEQMIDPFRPLLAACAAAAAVAPDIKVLKGGVVSGDQFVSPAEQKERILATFGDLCCEMEGCTIAQAAYLNGVPLVVVRAISDKPCAEGRVVDYNTFEKKAACDCARIAARMVKL